MKRKCDGWSCGGAVFHDSGRTVIVGDMALFDSTARTAARKVAARICPGKTRKNGAAATGSEWTIWLVDYVNHIINGTWNVSHQDQRRITEAHVNRIAEILGLPESWKGGSVYYCVEKSSIIRIERDMKR